LLRGIPAGVASPEVDTFPPAAATALSPADTVRDIELADGEDDAPCSDSRSLAEILAEMGGVGCEWSLATSDTKPRSWGWAWAKDGPGCC